MRIGVPRVRNGSVCTYSVAASSESSLLPADRMWFTVESHAASMVTPRSDPALVALLLPAMAVGEDIHVAGAVTDVLEYRLNTDVQDLLLSFMPNLRRVRIHASRALPPMARAMNTAMGFSAGIDSYAALYDFGTAAPRSMRVNCLTFTNVGSHGYGRRRLFLERLDRVRQAAQEIELPVVAIDSNLGSYYDPLPELVYERTHVMRNAATGHLLASGVGSWLHAATYHWSDVTISDNSYMSRIEPFLLPLLSSAGVSMESVGGQYTRTQKTRIVAGMPESWEHLDVCVSAEGAGNCSICDKCLRTQLTLEILGQLSKYDSVFDHARFLEKRDEVLALVRQSNRPLHADIRRFAAETGFDLGGGSEVG